MAGDVRSRVTGEGGEARGASLFAGLKPCHYDMYAKIPSDFSMWQASYKFTEPLETKDSFGKS